VSEFRANAAKFIDQVRETRKPVIITQHGRSAAVLVDIDSYEGMLDTIGLLQDLLISAEESRQGKTIPFEDVLKEMRALIKR
jgi:prevent-host-death family protein